MDPSTSITPPNWQDAIDSAKALSALVSPFNAALSEFITVDERCILLKQRASLLAHARDQAPVVLITGQSGSGKELFAKALHQPAHLPFVALNLGSLPTTLYQALLFGHAKGTFTGAHDDKAGAIAAAKNGTLFLDEIGDMPMDQQASLLRVLENWTYSVLGEYIERPINCRIVAATNVNLPQAVAEGRFRADLYARLFGFTLNIPPFSERVPDIYSICQYYGLPSEQATQLVTYHMPAIERYGVRFIKAAANSWTTFREIPSV